MNVIPTSLAGVFVIERQIHTDHRGFLSRLFCAEALRPAGWVAPIAQVNHTFTAAGGTVRGLHFQYPPHAEMKLVTCVRGAVWDVAVDIRRGSPTFLRWHAERLSRDNERALLIPEGCAHGFQTLEDNCELLYCHSAAYERDADGGLRHDDPAVAIRWPAAVTHISDRDRSHPLVGSDFQGLAPPAINPI